MNASYTLSDAVSLRGRSYGKALRIRRNSLRALFTVFCLLTPATNWLLPFTSWIIRSDITWRYE